MELILRFPEPFVLYRGGDMRSEVWVVGEGESRQQLLQRLHGYPEDPEGLHAPVV